MKSLFKILFITHEVSRTGAPLILLQFLEWIRKNELNIEISLLSKKTGVLKDRFRRSADKYYELSEYQRVPLTFLQETKKRFLNKIGISKPHPRESLFEKLGKEGFDLIYANTVVSLPVAKKIKTRDPGAKLLLHIHELPQLISISCPDFNRYISEVDSFIAASELVKEELICKYSIAQKKVKRIYEFTPSLAIKKVKKESTFIVGGAGTVHWRKGSDLFIQLARYIKTHYPSYHIQFNWIGSLTSEDLIIVEGDINKADLQEYIFFKGEKEDPEEYFSQFDIFALTSREDPFPLVAIEMGMLGIAIICFEGATGTQEVLVKGGGKVVPYLNIEAMAEQIVNYYNDRKKLEEAGLEAHSLFSEFTPENQCPKIYTEIKHLLRD